MKHFKKLDQKGFSHHIIIPIVAIVMVAGIGSYIITRSKALTIGGSNPTVVNSKTQKETQTKALAIEAAGHRGITGSYQGGYADQNTIKSCMKAISVGADVCEFDIRITLGGMPILMHDANIGAVTAGGSKCDLNVADYRYKEIAACKLNHGDTIPSLENFAKAMSPYQDRIKFIAEIKDSTITSEQLKNINVILEKYGFSGAKKNLSYESFYKTKLQAMKKVAPATPGLYISNNLPKLSDVSGLDGIIIPYEKFKDTAKSNPSYVSTFTSKGKRVVPWNVNTTTQMRDVVDMGGTGFITDNAETITALKKLRMGNN